ncbi:MAG: hypothetical protein MSIBF_06345 [Candidatus Altiarchaeales archaeon IMC4]|nr:MAG: hypothetical protein MSIBF_06345 [Candidatus Altiarchaeales archaeon IMC4]
MLLQLNGSLWSPGTATTKIDRRIKVNIPKTTNTESFLARIWMIKFKSFIGTKKCFALLVSKTQESFEERQKFTG